MLLSFSRVKIGRIVRERWLNDRLVGCHIHVSFCGCVMQHLFGLRLEGEFKILPIGKYLKSYDSNFCSHQSPGTFWPTQELLQTSIFCDQIDRMTIKYRSGFIWLITQ